MHGDLIPFLRLIQTILIGVEDISVINHEQASDLCTYLICFISNLILGIMGKTSLVW